jgi:hypothetical protein
MDTLKGEMASPIQAEFHPESQQMSDQLLSGCKGVMMKQSVNLAEAAASTMGFGCCEMENVYKLYDLDSGKQLFYVKEESECWKRCCCAPKHQANLLFYPEDNKEGQVYFVAEKPGKCCCFEIAVCDCCRKEITMAGEGNRVIGNVYEKCGCVECCTPQFDIANSKGGKAYGSITGPTCCIGELCTNTFETEVGGNKGEITKKGVNDIQGAARELATDADNFFIEFPEGCSNEQKATLLAAGILMDYSFFEDDGAFECDPFKPSCSVTLCNLFCCGITQPCKCTCDCSGGGDE